MKVLLAFEALKGNRSVDWTKGWDVLRHCMLWPWSLEDRPWIFRPGRGAVRMRRENKSSCHQHTNIWYESHYMSVIVIMYYSNMWILWKYLLMSNYNCMGTTIVKLNHRKEGAGQKVIFGPVPCDIYIYIRPPGSLGSILNKEKEKGTRW